MVSLYSFSSFDSIEEDCRLEKMVGSWTYDSSSAKICFLRHISTNYMFFSPGFVDITLHTTTMRKKITMRMMMHPTKDIRVTADMVSW